MILEARKASNMSHGRRGINFANLVVFRSWKQSLSEAVDWKSKRKQLLNLALVCPAFALVNVHESSCLQICQALP